MRKRMIDFDKKSPRQGRVNELKQKLPFLKEQQKQLRTSIEFATAMDNQMAGRGADLEGLTPTHSSPYVYSSPSFGATGNSFQSKGLQLHKV